MIEAKARQSYIAGLVAMAEQGIPPIFETVLNDTLHSDVFPANGAAYQ